MIINEIALILNNTIINLYNNGIHFYQIIISLIIIDFIIYQIGNIIIITKYRR